TLVIDEKTGELVVPNGSVGFRWDGSQRWNLEERAGEREYQAQLSVMDHHDDVLDVAFPYFEKDQDEILIHKVRVKRITDHEGNECFVTTVFDLTVANYGIDRGLNDQNAAKDYFDDAAYTPKWQAKITGVKPEDVIQVAREFAQNAHDTKGRSMVIVGAGLNHWYHMDMSYRSIINMLMMCGCIGKSGGGWCHYVGQEKLRPQTGWAPLAFG